MGHAVLGAVIAAARWDAADRTPVLLWLAALALALGLAFLLGTYFLAQPVSGPILGAGFITRPIGGLVWTLIRGRFDLRNHRKLLVVDSQVAFMGSQNLIDSSYLMPANLRIGRHWHDLNIEVSGPIISSLEAVFALDWLTETGESLADAVPQPVPEPGNQPLQLLPSGPGYRTMPNLRLFTALIHRAQHKLSITSPYFVPEDSLLEAVTTAAMARCCCGSAMPTPRWR